MNYQVIYYTRTGHTKKVAEAIASELDVEAEDVKNASLDPSAIILMGSGCYGGSIGSDMKTFIENNDFSLRTVALFGTSGAGIGREVKKMAKLLEDKGARVERTYHCKGQVFKIINRGKPDEQDLEEAKRFAKAVKR
ncbi:flavodoxin [archaeon]|nr:MAG: flavodoxin [archaeon]